HGAAVPEFATSQVDLGAGGEVALDVVEKTVLTAAQVEAADQDAAIDDAFVPVTSQDRPVAIGEEVAVVDQPVVVTFGNFHRRALEGGDGAFSANPVLDVTVGVGAVRR